MSLGLTLIGISFSIMALFPFELTRIACIIAGVAIILCAFVIKSTEWEEIDEIPESPEKSVLKVKIITRVKANMDKLAFVLTSA